MSLTVGHDRKQERVLAVAAESGSTPLYSLGEEIASSIIHGVGTLLAIAGLAALTTFASLRGSAWHVVGCSLFGLTLILLYTSSTLYLVGDAASCAKANQKVHKALVF